MHTQQELLDMIATEAVEGDYYRPNLPPIEKSQPTEHPQTVNYPLRLVRYEDGRLEWRDD